MGGKRKALKVSREPLRQLTNSEKRNGEKKDALKTNLVPGRLKEAVKRVAKVGKVRMNPASRGTR